MSFHLWVSDYWLVPICKVYLQAARDKTDRMMRNKTTVRGNSLHGGRYSALCFYVETTGGTEHRLIV